MKTRSGNDPVQKTKTEANVCVDKDGVKRNEKQISEYSLIAKSKDEKRNERDGANQNAICDMNSRGGEPIHLLTGVVDRVEAPEPWNLVQRPMSPVFRKISNQKHF